MLDKSDVPGVAPSENNVCTDLFDGTYLRGVPTHCSTDLHLRSLKPAGSLLN